MSASSVSLSSSTPAPSPSSAPSTRGSGSRNLIRPKLTIAVTEADSPLGHAIACRLLATNQWAKVLAIIRSLPLPTPDPNPQVQIRGNPLAAHLHSLGATLVPSTSRPHLLRAFQAARALVLVPPASADMPNQVARILDLVKLAGSPVTNLGPVNKDTRGVRAVVLVSDVAAQFPTVEVKIEPETASGAGAAESNSNNKIKMINVAKVYKDTEEIVLGACKRATSIVRAGVIMQDLLPLIEPGAQHTSIRLNANMDSKFAPVNVSDLALGVHVLAHCLATGRPHPAFATAGAAQPTASTAGKGKGKGPAASPAPSAKPTGRAPHARIYLFTSPTFESLASIHAHLTRALAPYNWSAASLKPGTDPIHLSANMPDAALHAHLTAKHLAARAPGVRAFHTDRIVYQGALIRLGKLATARSAELERLILRPPTRLAQVMADHGKRFVPAVMGLDKVAIGAGKDEGVGERLEVGIAVAGTEE